MKYTGITLLSVAAIILLSACMHSAPTDDGTAPDDSTAPTDSDTMPDESMDTDMDTESDDETADDSTSMDDSTEDGSMMDEGSDDTAMDTDTEGDAMDAESISGYIDYDSQTVDSAVAQGQNVALFFHADWCPSCRALEENIEENIGDISSDTAIFKVDYDTSVALRRAHGVTMQHTIVYLSADTDTSEKKLGANTLDDIVTGFPQTAE